MSKLLIEKIKQNKKVQYFLLAILIFILIIVVIFSLSSNKNVDKENNAIDIYVDNLETKLSEILSKVQGAGDVSVIITVESGMETVLAMKTTTTETSAGKETIETPILVNGKTVVLKENYPKIIGVLIVTEGGNNISVLNKIQQATVSLLNINVNQIEILTMK